MLEQCKNITVLMQDAIVGRAGENMTKLSAIVDHKIYLLCHCGHQASVPVSDLLERLPDTTTVHQVTRSAKCKGCGHKGNIKAMRIVFASTV